MKRRGLISLVALVSLIAIGTGLYYASELMGKRILPDGWVHYATTPAPQAPNHEFGSHFWLKLPKEYAGAGYSNRLPENAFHAVGHEAEFLTVIPSHKLVIVRLGLTRFASAWQHDKFINEVLESVKS